MNAASESAAPVAALFEPAGAGLQAAPATRGPWDERMMHGGAPSALLAHAIEQTQPGAAELVVARLTIEFLGGVPVGPVEVRDLAGQARQALSDRRRHAGCGRAAGLPGPGGAPAARRHARRRGGAAAAAATSRCLRLTPASRCRSSSRPRASSSIPTRPRSALVGGELGSGHAIAWIRLRGELLPGVAPSPLARACAAADFANGLSWILPFDEWLFVNTELTVHLHREPVGEWIGLDARTTSDASGVGLASGVLHDERGRFGTCAQALFVQRAEA